MKLDPRVWVIAALSAVAALGLWAPGLTGQVGTFLWLGVFPGMALARLILPRAAALTRWTLGLTLSPLASTVAGWALYRGGLDLATSARLVGLAGWILFAGGEARSLGSAPDDPDAAPPSRFAWAWALASMVFVSLPATFNPYMRIYSDTWVHGAIVREIQNHGVPPVDPRYFGLHMNYVWFHDFFFAELVSIRGQDPFVFMVLLNVMVTGLMFWLVWQIAWALWGSERAARGTLVLFTVGLNAGAYLLTPLSFARTLTGEVRGMAEVRRLLSLMHVDSAEVIYVMQAPFAWMVHFWDKVTLGNALGYAYLFLLLHFLSLARLLRGGSPRWLAVAFVTGAGSMLLHSVLGLGMVPVTTGAVALGLLLRRSSPWLPAAARMAPFWAAVAAGFATTLPYVASIARGYRQESSGLGHHWIEPGWRMPWTLLTACAITSLFAWPGIRRAWRERMPFAAWLSIWLLGMVLFQCVVHLPEGNEHKFVWVAFLVLALLGGADFLPAMQRWRARLGTAGFAIVCFVLFAVPSLAIMQGYIRDPMRHQSEALNPRPGEPRMLAWIHDSTSVNDVFLETKNRDLLMVQGPRRLLVGLRAGAERGAYPVADFERRREITADLFGPVGRLDEDLAGLAEIVARARGVHPVGEVNLLFRTYDFAAGDEPWRRLEAAAGPRAVKRYDADGFRVYALRLPPAP